MHPQDETAHALFLLETLEAIVLCIWMLPKSNQHGHIPQSLTRKCSIQEEAWFGKIQPQHAVYITWTKLGILPYAE